MTASGLSLGPYIIGCVTLVVVVTVVAWGSFRLRRALLPVWSGAAARLAEIVIGIAVPLGLAMLLGTCGAFRWTPVATASVVAGLAMGVIASRLTARSRLQPSPDLPQRSRAEEVAVSVAAGALVVAQWATHVADALGRGMTHPDTLWYHAPYAAELVRTGRTMELLDRTDALPVYYPLNANLVHAFVTLPFDRDVLSPFVNLAWFALTLLAAWCIGRRHGVGALSVLGALVVLSLPMLSATQPGQASNDVAVSALLLTAIALLLESDLAPIPTALAGVAAGLALGAKLTVLVPVAVLTAGVCLLAVRRRRPMTAVVWTIGLAVSGSYWYIRNWVEAGSPLPWLPLRLGPFALRQPVEDNGPTFLENVGDGTVWRDLYVPGFWQALGRVWPVVLALACCSAVLALARRRPTLERLVGVAVLIALAGYLVTPSTGGLNFTFNVRYLTPALMLAFVFLPVAFEHASTTLRRAGLVGFASLIALNATSPHRERIAAWPRDERWIAVLVGLGVIVIGAFVLTRWRQRFASNRTAIAGALVAAALLAGWPLQRRYLEHRYVAAGLHVDRIHEYFRDVQNSDVVVYGSAETYPMMGLDLSNRVRPGQGESTEPDAEPCTQWADLLRGDYQYAVVTHQGFIGLVTPPDAWFTDGQATEVLREGANAVYRLNGPIRPVGCAR